MNRKLEGKIKLAKRRHREEFNEPLQENEAVFRTATKRTVITVPRESYTDAPEPVDDTKRQERGEAYRLAKRMLMAEPNPILDVNYLAAQETKNRTASAMLARISEGYRNISPLGEAFRNLVTHGTATISQDMTGVTVHWPRRCLCCGGWEWEIQH